MILLAEHDEPTSAAKKKRQVAASESLTSTPKNRVWDFENTPSGRPVVEPQLSWESATGSVQYTYQIASGRAEWLARDPLGEWEGPNIYAYVLNNPVNWIDPFGLAGGGGLPQNGFGAAKNGSPGSGKCEDVQAELIFGGIVIGSVGVVISGIAFVAAGEVAADGAVVEGGAAEAGEGGAANAGDGGAADGGGYDDGYGPSEPDYGPSEPDPDDPADDWKR